MKIRVFITIPLLLSGLLLLSCKSDSPPEQITIGKTVKARSTFVKDSDQYKYYWYYDFKPGVSQAGLFVENDKALFTPDVPGLYTLVCSVRSPSGDVVQKDIFKYVAISPEEKPASPVLAETDTLTAGKSHSSETDTVQQNSPSPEKAPPKITGGKIQLPDIDLLPSNEGNYAIQISSWKTLKYARNNLRQLKKTGIEGYIHRQYFPESDEVWFRVRVGNFMKYNQAAEYRNALQKLLKTDIWVDRVQKGS